jgi:nucleoside-diphosphate-sugar epimerase
MRKKVLVVGCTGEVGSRLTKLLLDNDYVVQGISGFRSCTINHSNHICSKIDLLKFGSIQNILEFKPEIMVLTAWVTSPKVFWESQINHEWVVLSKKIIKQFKEIGGKYLIVTSTCAEYSWSGTQALNETSELNPVSVYGKSKLELLRWLENVEIPFLWTRTFFQSGLNEPTGRLIPSLIDSILNGKIFEVKNMRDIRDFVFIEDVANLIKILILKEQVGIVNIGSGKGIQIESIANLVANGLGRADLLKFSSSARLPSTVVSDPRKLLSIVGKFSWTPLSKAISDSIEIRKNDRLFA